VIQIPLSPQAKTGSEMNRFFLWLFLNSFYTELHRAYFELDCVDRATQSPKFLSEVSDVALDLARGCYGSAKAERWWWRIF
jgi:hypothetical protein